MMSGTPYPCILLAKRVYLTRERERITRRMKSELYQKAKYIAEHDDVKTKKDCLVLFSISFLPTKENKERAFNHIAENPQKQMIDHTPCGKKLEEMNLSAHPEQISEAEIYEIWHIASQRLIQEASGNITAFVDNSHPRSTFRTVELPAILSNDKITTINFRDKKEFTPLISAEVV